MLAFAGKAQTPRQKRDLNQQNRAAWRKVLRWSDHCEQGFQSNHVDDPSSGGLEFNLLSDGKYLVAVQCATGAYQRVYTFIYYDEARPSQPPATLKLKQYDHQKNGRVTRSYATEVGGSYTLDRRRRVLEIVSKGNGQQGCDLDVKYRLVGSRAAVQEARIQPCNAQSNDPYHWYQIKRP